MSPKMTDKKEQKRASVEDAMAMNARCKKLLEIALIRANAGLPAVEEIKSALIATHKAQIHMSTVWNDQHWKN